MDQVTQQNAAMVEETTAASHSLSEETSQLTDLVSQFEIGAGDDQTLRRELRKAAPHIALPPEKSKKPAPRKQQERPPLKPAASAPPRMATGRSSDNKAAGVQIPSSRAALPASFALKSVFSASSALRRSRSGRTASAISVSVNRGVMCCGQFQSIRREMQHQNPFRLGLVARHGDARREVRIGFERYGLNMHVELEPGARA